MPEKAIDQKWLCQRCGNCCKWPGLVRVNDQEVDAYAEFLNMPVDQFIDEYTEVTPDRKGLTLISRKDHSCIFLEDGNVCKVNHIKPFQCSGFPNEWNNPGWQDKCEAVLVDLKDFGKLALERDQKIDQSKVK